MAATIFQKRDTRRPSLTLLKKILVCMTRNAMPMNIAVSLATASQQSGAFRTLSVAQVNYASVASVRTFVSVRSMRIVAQVSSVMMAHANLSVRVK